MWPNDVFNVTGGLNMQPTQLGHNRRMPYSSERDFFGANPGVAGMAAQDNQVVMNPFTSLSPASLTAVELNEAIRIAMRAGGRTTALTPEQTAALGGAYTTAPAKDQSDTIMARQMSGDPSGGSPTFEQSMYANQLRAMNALMRKSSGGLR